MKVAIKKKWVEALRGGKYKQGKSALRNHDDTFCCLGVLCDLHAKTMKKGWKDGGRYLTSTAFVPRAVAKWAGLSEKELAPSTYMVNRDVKLPNGAFLSELNDAGKSFKYIASRIEKGL